MTRERGPDLLRPLINAGMKAKMLTANEEDLLARQARAGSEAAFERLLTAHLRLVLSIAQGLRKYGLPMEDLVSEGLVGLVESARRFDPDRGARLATYAAKSIRASMRQYTLAHRRIVRLPSSRAGRKLLANLRGVQHELAQASGQDAEPQAVAEVLEVNVRDVEEIEAALSARDVPYGGEPDSTAVELACDAASAESLLADAEERESAARSLLNALSVLSVRERWILQERHSMQGKASLAAIARGIGLSRERVRQIEKRARGKVREAIAAS